MVKDVHEYENMYVTLLLNPPPREGGLTIAALKRYLLFVCFAKYSFFIRKFLLLSSYKNRQDHVAKNTDIIPRSGDSPHIFHVFLHIRDNRRT